ncbi:hypothetical protein IFR05_012962 [Cadophora sp. M221]|nr:hypothetical protein IFR05_012962 [Cadophora sp. M221]
MVTALVPYASSQRPTQPSGEDFSGMYSKLYDPANAPFPGYSMGPKDKDFRAGSFTCFIRHNDKESLEAIADRISSNEDGTPAKAFWEQVQMQGLAWNTNIGHVIATSGQNQLDRFEKYDGRLDWCIFEFHTLKQDTEFPAFSPHDNGSGFQLHNPRIKKRLKAEGFFTSTAESARKSRPVTQPRTKLPEEEEMLFKVSSRTTPLREAICSGIKVTKYDKAAHTVPTREFCFSSQYKMSWALAKDDSGAMLFDKEFSPVAVVWGGCGEDIPDITYVTPFSIVFRHIEDRMGWESTPFCLQYGGVTLNGAV